jgi:hypothetical protein
MPLRGRIDAFLSLAKPSKDEEARASVACGWAFKIPEFMKKNSILSIYTGASSY